MRPSILPLLVVLPALALPAEPPERLSATGLYEPGTGRIASGVLSFTPQYALWSDGATKRRWVYIPPGSAIDASRPGGWDFPAGTRFWKEFSHERPVETRLIERLADGNWRYLAYRWLEDGSDAVLAPDSGVPAHPVAGAPGGRYDIPSRDDCRACHEGQAVPVLGFSALQLSPDRDPLAPHAEPLREGDVRLAALVQSGRLVGLPTSLPAPGIAATSAVERAALGYLHANCGHCHSRADAIADVDIVLAQGTGVTEPGIVAVPSEFTLPGAALRIAPGSPEASVLWRRMRSRHPLAQMPPLGTRLADEAGLALVGRWILEMSPATEGVLQ